MGRFHGNHFNVGTVFHACPVSGNAGHGKDVNKSVNPCNTTTVPSPHSHVSVRLASSGPILIFSDAPEYLGTSELAESNLHLYQDTTTYSSRGPAQTRVLLYHVNNTNAGGVSGQALYFFVRVTANTASPSSFWVWRGRTSYGSTPSSKDAPYESGAAAWVAWYASNRSDVYLGTVDSSNPYCDVFISQAVSPGEVLTGIVDIVCTQPVPGGAPVSATVTVFAATSNAFTTTPTSPAYVSSTDQARGKWEYASRHTPTAISWNAVNGTEFVQLFDSRDTNTGEFASGTTTITTPAGVTPVNPANFGVDYTLTYDLTVSGDAYGSVYDPGGACQYWMVQGGNIIPCTNHYCGWTSGRGYHYTSLVDSQSTSVFTALPPGSNAPQNFYWSTTVPVTCT